MALQDPFGALSTLRTSHGDVRYFKLHALEKAGVGPVGALPYSLRVLLEAVLRNVDGFSVLQEHVRALSNWNPAAPGEQEIPFKCARVVLQDFTGVPCVVDLAAMRSAMLRLGGDPKKINPQIPVDLVIDHSVQVDHYGSASALDLNARLEFHRNRERYEFLRWGQKAFDNFRVVPPATGIVHQVNLEYLAKVVFRREVDGAPLAYPDTLVGTDSHTTMINGLGVLGWGVGGIEAESAMLGQPMYMLMPQVVGFKLTGRLREGATATDLVLRVTELLRQFGVVEKFVEFYGTGLEHMSVADRATISNMAPEYGATIGFFPVDDQTLRYLRLSGRSAAEIDLVERYCKEQGLFRTADAAEPRYSATLELDLGSVEPSLAGPKRPQDRVALSRMKAAFNEALTAPLKKQGFELKPADLTRAAQVRVPQNGHEQTHALRHGSVVIAAITSCTNTSNPSVMLGAGLVARKAVQRGLKVKPWVKTSLAPGSRVVTDYLDRSGLSRDLDALGFQVVGYGCTTCIGNSGPLPDHIRDAVMSADLVASSVLSGNRNFEGRINPHVKANYLASPPLVVAYALAGTTDVDLLSEPLGTGSDGEPVYLRDIWPTQREIDDAVAQFVTPDMFASRYADVFTGPPEWQQLGSGGGAVYQWNADSTYIQEPPFFTTLTRQVSLVQPIRGARCLVMVGDSVTTDHISPAGDIAEKSPAGAYLMERGVGKPDFNSYGARRGNDRVMTRGTFANVRLRNLLAPGTEGGWTTYLGNPAHARDCADAEQIGKTMSVYDAAMLYAAAGTPLVALAGRDYGMGSSRDWAAKGTLLLGVKAVIAVSFERIHRSNLVGMGVLPCVFKPAETREALGLTGHEVFDFVDLSDALRPQQMLRVVATEPGSGRKVEFDVQCRIDTPVEVEYYRNGGLLQTVLRKLA